MSENSEGMMASMAVALACPPFTHDGMIRGKFKLENGKQVGDNESWLSRYSMAGENGMRKVIPARDN
jgi:hypothetical protein